MPDLEAAPPDGWNLELLREHLQFAVDLEMWTIPFYLTALYSIRDQTSEAYQLIQSVVYQEMLHVELAANVANAFGADVTFDPPVYGQGIPHLDFALDSPDPTEIYSRWSSDLGPLDPARIDAMCLVEYPEWDDEAAPCEADLTRYGSIGAFYRCVESGVRELADEITPGRNQLDDFQRYYQDAPSLTVSESGEAGLSQVLDLLEAITEQGEGQNERDPGIPARFRNTADDPSPAVDHFEKFTQVRASGRLPATYEGSPEPSPGSPGATAQARLVDNFAAFLAMTRERFAGKDPQGYWAAMTTVGANVLTCWQDGAVPRFS